MAESQKEKPKYKGRATYIGFNSLACEAAYRCPICEKEFGEWRTEENEWGMACCPYCKSPLKGL